VDNPIFVETSRSSVFTPQSPEPLRGIGMRSLRTLIAPFGCVSLSAPAIAATLGSVQGTVMVNRGGGYQPVYGPTELNPGDLVVVNPGGSAQIAYSDGCSVPVQVGGVVTVGAQSPCATQATGPGGPGLGSPGIFALGVGAAAGTVGVFLATANDKDKSASP
jgi:hypothetical protein